MRRKKRGAEDDTLSVELSEAELGDARLTRRLGMLVDRLAERPSESVPKALDDAELEGAYRFFGNDRVTPAAILEPHIRATARRAAAQRRILVVQDTTEFEFGGAATRQGLGRLLRPGQGFFGHVALAVSADGRREPLGLLSLETIVRLDAPTPRAQRTKADHRGESARWRRAVDEAERRLGGAVEAIHVMDREADSYRLLAELQQLQRTYVLRSCHDRVLVRDAARAHLWAAARAAPPTLRREVPLSPRPPMPGPKGTRHPTRRMRVARLAVAATTVAIPRMRDGPVATAEAIAVNVIHVCEPRPPRGQPAVEWILLTSLPIATPGDIGFVVDCYRGRWLIEEYFKALKTGCQYEKRQLETSHALLNALAVLAPVRVAPPAPASPGPSRARPAGDGGVDPHAA